MPKKTTATLMAKAKSDPGKFWSVVCETTDTGEEVGHLYLYGEIASESWWGDEVTPQTLKDDINALGTVGVIKVHIFSNGGDVFAGFAIYSILKQHPAAKEVYIEGIAASMATVIAMAGDTVYISSVALMLIHNPMFILWGYYNREELLTLVRDLDKLREPIIGAYVNKTGLSRDDVVEVMDGDDGIGTWFTAEEAIDAGLADEYIPEESEEALGAVAWLGGDTYSWGGKEIDLSMYQDAPKLTDGRRNLKMSKPQNKKPVKSTRNRASSKPKARVRAKAKAVDEIVNVTCPECEAEFEAEIPDDAEGIVTITCPDCEAEFDYDTEAGAVAEVEEGDEENEDPDEVIDEDGEEEAIDEDGEDDPEKDDTSAKARWAKAERKRVKALRTLKAVHPEQEDLINKCEDAGTSYAVTCRKVMEAVNKASKDAANSSKGKAGAFIAGMKTDGEKAGKVGAVPNSGVAVSTGDKVLDGIAESVARFEQKRR